MRTIQNAIGHLAALLVLAATPCFAQSNWGVVQTFHIGGEGSWDYVTVDAPSHRLFVTRSTHTQAIDMESGKVLGDIPGQVRSHGVAVVPRLNRGFITDGGGTGHRGVRPEDLCGAGDDPDGSGFGRDHLRRCDE